jgi:hypothetical protein
MPGTDWKTAVGTSAFLLFMLACSDRPSQDQELTTDDLAGALYYMGENACVALGIVMEQVGGTVLDVSPFSRSFCRVGSTVECGKGRCLLACANASGSDTTALYDIAWPAYYGQPGWAVDHVFEVRSAISSADTVGTETEFGRFLRDQRGPRPEFVLFKSPTDCEYSRALNRADGSRE